MDFNSLISVASDATLTHLGEDVTYTPTVGAAASVRGVFDASFQRADVATPGVASSGPAIFLRLSDLPSDPETDTTATVTVSGTAYRTVSCEKDGRGMVVVHLHEEV